MNRSFPTFFFSLSFQVTGKARGFVAGNILFNVSSATVVNVKMFLLLLIGVQTVPFVMIIC